MEYFSDTERGKREQTTTQITVPVWNGIVAIFEQYINNNSLAKDFPGECPDGRGVYRTERVLLEDRILAEIPQISVPIERKSEFREIYDDSSWESKRVLTIIDNYSTLDLIQFCHNHISDPYPIGDVHEYFGHYHLAFRDRGRNQQQFRNDINSLFQRNGIAFELTEEGLIRRIVPEELGSLIKYTYRTKDDKLNQLLNESRRHFLLPKMEDRNIAIQLLWDAFERAKTFYEGDKKASSIELISRVSNGNKLLGEYIAQESKTLTEIGNKFLIRHSETDKVEIVDEAHIDYLYFRMFSIINLFIRELEK